MPDEPQTPPERRARLIAPLALVVVLAAILGIAWIVQRPKPVAVEPPPPAVAAPQPVIPATIETPALNRGDLARLAADQADAYAAGRTPARAGKDPLIGRAFAVSIAFACGGPQVRPAGDQAFADYDIQKQTVRLVAQPSSWTSLPIVQQGGQAADIEAVEGFWLPHPWTASEGCLPRRDGAAPATPTPPSAQTLGLAQLFTTDASRAARHADRPYESVRRIGKSDPSVAGHWYWLRLSGRITGFPDGRALRCWSESPDHRPICLYGVTFDKVVFADGVSGEAVAEWP